MKRFRVMWGINIHDAPTPYHAALEALRVQRDPESIATVFMVEDLETGDEFMLDLNAKNFVSLKEH